MHAYNVIVCRSAPLRDGMAVHQVDLRIHLVGRLAQLVEHPTVK